MPLFLLPERRRLRGDLHTAPSLQRLLARGDTITGATGDVAQIQAAFDIIPRGWSAAALSRQHDANDATLNTWLRADPGHVRADMGMGRLLACGELGLTPAEAEAFLRPLRPLFGDEGFPMSAPVPSRWYLMLPREAKLPAFADPENVLGDDLYTHLPQGEAGRRWRRLLNEAQVILHNHPLNAERAAAGKVTVNTLWFWGGGTLPDSVRTPHRRVFSDDPVLRALATQASIPAAPVADVNAGNVAPEDLIDLRDSRDLATLERDWIAPLTAARQPLQLAFADGHRVAYAAKHRWRFWRRTPAQLA